MGFQSWLDEISFLLFLKKFNKETTPLLSLYQRRMRPPLTDRSSLCFQRGQRTQGLLIPEKAACGGILHQPSLSYQEPRETGFLSSQTEHWKVSLMFSEKDLLWYYGTFHAFILFPYVACRSYLSERALPVPGGMVQQGYEWWFIEPVSPQMKAGLSREVKSLQVQACTYIARMCLESRDPTSHTFFYDLTDNFA